MKIIIKPLSQDLIGDFFYFFENVAFTDNPDWSDCFCYFYHFDGSDDEWIKRTREENRQTVEVMIQTGKMKGYLAYSGEKPVGWCNVNDKQSFARLATIKEVWGEKKERICSIVCFVISLKNRRMGIASRMLEQICKDYSESPYDCLEAYPRRGNLTNAEQYHGPVAMYLRAGFTIYRELNGYYIVRKKLSHE
jgi:ribosomal protein S18 acetylase RimI-like enzyme